MNNWFQKQWAGYTLWHVLLIPVSWIFYLLISFRKLLYSVGLLKSTCLSAPVIVVGNITVGGTGKTPFVIWLAEQLKVAGFKPGIISRGYGGSAISATAVFANSLPEQVGDEPVLIAKRTGCPLFVSVDRAAAGMALLQANPQCNVIISDDGLQHYALQRSIEIALVNSDNMFGNQQLLPAGPLRECISRLKSVDALVDSGSNSSRISSLLQNNQPDVYAMQVNGHEFKSLDDAQAIKLANEFAVENLVAIAGIGSPERFFNQLSGLGLQFERQVFPDHHAFSAQDLAKFSGKTILMTEKDAVKCAKLSLKEAWYLPIGATFDDDASQASLIQLILQKLRN